ncbi:putative Cuticular protein [Daphnia magna]|uniref:Putative Cuticular protein n=1 Tax=Daphnia magna TaxID=35525 RepID=A0A164Z215_9CRUS|nr:putative Cuticular protein [Daphnia magna]
MLLSVSLVIVNDDVTLRTQLPTVTGILRGRKPRDLVTEQCSLTDASVGRKNASVFQLSQLINISNMKFIVLAAVLAVAAANSYKAAEYAPKYEAPKYEEVTYAPQPYSFGYDVQDKESYTDFDHSEKADGKVTSGSYRVALPDGRTQIVSYQADENGYNADVKYEGEAQYPEYKEPQYKAASYPSPAYPAPAYPAPAYKAPAYKAPEYKAPAYKAPEYKAPSYPAPAYKAPSYPAPSYKAPSYPAPAYKAPSYPAPAYSAPVYKAPSYPKY